jgi:hypothetical protein
MALVHQRTITVLDMTMNVVTLTDRRPDATGVPVEFLFQTELETLLYGADAIGTTGACYRLLQRAGVGGLALPLRRACVREGLVTDADWDTLRGLMHTGVRALTLVPVATIPMAMATLGRSAQSEALLNALELPFPETWASNSDDQEESEDHVEDEDDRDGGGGSNSNGDSGGAGVDGSSSERRSEDGADDDCPSTDEEAEPHVVGDELHRSPPFEVSAALETQLQAFVRFRTQSVNRQRRGRAVASITVREDRRCILRFLSWLQRVKGVRAPTLGLFASPRIGAVVESFIEESRLSERKDSTIAKIVASLVAASRYTHAVLKAKAAPGSAVDTSSLDELLALHAQVLSEARETAKFAAALPPKAWLDWSEAQIARLKAEKAVATYTGENEAKRLRLARTCCLLKLLTAMPPDRVGVYRQLQLGRTLKPVGERYIVDLSEPGAHKTSAIFGPSRTTVSESVAFHIKTLIDLDRLQPGEYLFHGCERRTPLSSSSWTRHVQRAFKRNSGVAFSPKDCRASFITFLRDGEHNDETLRAAANAMRHSSTTQASAAYDKHGSDRVVAAAVAVADSFAKKFSL